MKKTIIENGNKYVCARCFKEVDVVVTKPKLGEWICKDCLNKLKKGDMK